MRYSIEPRERRYVKGYGFLSFARNIGTQEAKVAKNMSNKYSENWLTRLKNLGQMQQRLLQKEQFKKQQKQLEI